MSTIQGKHLGFAAASLDPKAQTLDHLHSVVAFILNQVGCGTCGRVAKLRVDFLSDPPPDLAKQHVISFETGAIAGG